MKYFTPMMLIFFICLLYSCDPGTPQEFALQLAGASPAVLAVKNVTVIPMNEKITLENHTLIIENGKITAVGVDPVIPKEALIIDGRGKYLIPGLIDMHAHFFEDTDLLVFLANGVTTLRNPVGIPAHLDYKTGLAEGTLMGPECFIATPPFDGVIPVWPFNIAVNNPDEGEELVRLFHGAGFDYIKVYSRLLPNEYYRVVDTAAQLGVKVIGHVPDYVGVEKAIMLGQYSIEHYNQMAEEHYPLAAEWGTWFCPTLRVPQVLDLAKENFEFLESNLKDEYFHPHWGEKFIPFFIDKLGMRGNSTFRHYDLYAGTMRKAMDANVSLILGTDSTVPFIEPGFSIHDELAVMVEEGLTPYEALKTGTFNGADCLGILSRTGTIERGKEADLILLNSNPLEDIENSRDMAGVFSDGIYFSKEQLDLVLNRIKTYYEENPEIDSWSGMVITDDYDPVGMVRKYLH